MLMDLESIRSICWSTDDRLWDAYDRSIFDDGRAPAICRLVFPRYSEERGGRLRVSEQEARFAFADALAAEPFEYSVETPTQEGYQLSGVKPLSAQTDLTLYEPGGEPLLNVEFKSKGASPAAKSSFRIGKDVQKLLRESPPGLWFHLLERVDSTSIGKLLSVIASELVDLLGQFAPDGYEKTLLFHVCVLAQGFSIHKPVHLQSGVACVDSLPQQLLLEYRVNREELLDVPDENEWLFHYRGK